MTESDDAHFMHFLQAAPEQPLLASLANASDAKHVQALRDAVAFAIASLERIQHGKDQDHLAAAQGLRDALSLTTPGEVAQAPEEEPTTTVERVAAFSGIKASAVYKQLGQHAERWTLNQRVPTMEFINALLTAKPTEEGGAFPPIQEAAPTLWYWEHFSPSNVRLSDGISREPMQPTDRAFPLDEDGKVWARTQVTALVPVTHSPHA